MWPSQPVLQVQRESPSKMQIIQFVHIAHQQVGSRSAVSLSGKRQRRLLARMYKVPFSLQNWH